MPFKKDRDPLKRPFKKDRDPLKRIGLLVGIPKAPIGAGMP